MASRIVLSDEQDNALSCYMTPEGFAYIAIHDVDEGPKDGNYILLDKEDLTTLMSMLQDIHTNME